MTQPLVPVTAPDPPLPPPPPPPSRPPDNRPPNKPPGRAGLLLTAAFVLIGSALIAYGTAGIWWEALT